MSQEVIVVGAGGFGREALDVIEAINNAGEGTDLNVLGVVDDAPAAQNLARLGDRDIPYLGTTDSFLGTGRVAGFVVGVGNPTARESIAKKWVNAGFASLSLIHPSVNLGSNCMVGDGVVICSGVQVSTNVRIGNYVHLNPNATIGHDAVLEDFVSVNPGAIVSGEVRIASRALVGAGAVILQGRVVGQDAVVGASACVVRDVSAGVTVKGVPAR